MMIIKSFQVKVDRSRDEFFDSPRLFTTQTRDLKIGRLGGTWKKSTPIEEEHDLNHPGCTPLSGFKSCEFSRLWSLQLLTKQLSVSTVENTTNSQPTERSLHLSSHSWRWTWDLHWMMLPTRIKIGGSNSQIPWVVGLLGCFLISSLSFCLVECLPRALMNYTL